MSSVYSGKVGRIHQDEIPRKTAEEVNLVIECKCTYLSLNIVRMSVVGPTPVVNTDRLAWFTLGSIGMFIDADLPPPVHT